MDAGGSGTGDGPDGGEDGLGGVRGVELSFGAAAPPSGAMRGVAPPQVKLSLAILPDGTIHERRWSFAVAYEIPEHRRRRVGADAISLLWDENGWHVENVSFGDE